VNVSNDGGRTKHGFWTYVWHKCNPNKQFVKFCRQKFFNLRAFLHLRRERCSIFWVTSRRIHRFIPVPRLTWLADVVDASDADAQQRNRGQHTEKYGWVSRLISVGHSGTPQHRERVSCDALFGALDCRV